MNSRLQFASALALCFVIAGCHLPGSGAKTPTGQVVATVDGQEITLRDLNAEMAGDNITDPKLRKTAQDAALETIIARKALAQAAREQGVDKTADFALGKQRVEEALLANALQTKMAAAVPAPTPEEVGRFISDHPDLFAQRKVFAVDQVRTSRPDPAQLKALEPLKTMDDIVAYFNGAHVPFQRGPAQLDADALGPNLTAAMLKLPPKEVFVVPSGGLILVNEIESTTITPLTGEAATNLATAYLRRQHAQEAVARATQQILAKAAKTISYNAAYRPTPRTPAAPPPASATNAAGK